MKQSLLHMGIALLAAITTCCAAVSATVAPDSSNPEFDIVITGGRVIDPETGLDAVRSVGIKDGVITAVSEAPLVGARTLDATGRIVSPGFIDMHAHGQDILAGRVQALDGVTTGLELEMGILPIGAYYDRLAEEGRPINYGASVGWAHARLAVMTGTPLEADPNWFNRAFSNTVWQETLADTTQLQDIKQEISKGLDEGGLGIGILLGYAPSSGFKEFQAVNLLAATRNVPTFTHARHLSMMEPKSSFEGMAEVVAAAAGTGAHTHIVHLNSISLRDIETIGPMIRRAQQQGLKVTTEAYPYGAGATGIGGAMFKGEHWRERLGGIDASNFDAGGKRLTEEEFARLQKEAPYTGIVVHLLDENNAADRGLLAQSVLFPGGVIASDGGTWEIDGAPIADNTWPLPADAWNHPRAAGTYSRFLRIYVREQKAIDVLEAIHRVSYGPAKILQDAVPQMRRKGRIQVGADADIVVFDLEAVTDTATYEKPGSPSKGFDYVLVGGTVLVDEGTLDTSVLPGRPIRTTIK